MLLEHLISPWTNGLVEVQHKNIGTHLRIFLHNTPRNWSLKVHMNAYAHNSQPLSEPQPSPHMKQYFIGNHEHQ